MKEIETIMEEERIIKERRGKIYYISREEILNCFVSDDHFQHRIETLRKIRLPRNWLLRDVHYDFKRDSFAFLIFSQNFPPVERGAEYPVIEDLREIVVDVEELKYTDG